MRKAWLEPEITKLSITGTEAYISGNSGDGEKTEIDLGIGSLTIEGQSRS